MQVKSRGLKRNFSQYCARVVPFLLAVTLLGGGIRADESQTRPIVGWVVSATYPPGPDHEHPATCLDWNFKVVKRTSGPDGEWWRIAVSPVQDTVLASAEFELNPGQGFVRNLSVREYYLGTWHDNVYIGSNPTELYLESLIPVPVRYLSPTLIARQKASKTAAWIARYTLPAPPGTLRYARDYRFELHETSKLKTGDPAVEVDVRQDRRVGRAWRIRWQDGFPWWTEYDGPEFSARVVSIERGNR